MDKLIAFIKPALIVLLFLVAALPVISQQTASPFDLLPRLPQSNSPDSMITISASSNPFDINRFSARVNSPATSYTPQFQVEQAKKPLSVKEKNVLYQRFLFITIVTMMVILTLVVTIFRIFIAKIWKAFLNDNILSQMLREQGGGVTIGYFILYIVFFINAGIFVFLALRYYGYKIAESNLGTLLLCMGGIAGFYVFKHILLGIVRFVFPIDKEVSRYNFTVMIFNIIAGIALAPLILFAAYASAGITGFIIKFTIALLIGTIIFRGLRGLFIANRFFAWHKFHFFLYLCTVELAPLLVTIKLLGVL
jgi:hypothetical protein